MMADIMFTKKQYEDAIYHYEQLLESKPDHYEVGEYFLMSQMWSLESQKGGMKRLIRFSVV